MDNEAPRINTFRELIAHAADQHADKYVELMRGDGFNGRETAEFRRVVARIFVDAVCWAMAGEIHVTASNLIELDHLEPVLEVHRELSTVLYQAGVDRGRFSPGGYDAGQDDPGTSTEI